MNKAQLENIILARDKGEQWAIEQASELYNQDPDLYMKIRLELYVRKANEEDSYAQFMLGQILETVDHFEDSIFWLTRAATNGSVGAMRHLAYLYHFGQKGVPEDKTKSFEWNLKAANLGDAVARYHVGLDYSLGEAVERDVDKAIKWLTLSAEQGYPSAQKSLGDEYSNLLNDQRDDAKAVFWYSKAAEQGNEFAQVSLGECFAWGRGVEQNIEKAIYWYEQAGLAGYDQAREKASSLRRDYNMPMTKTEYDILVSDYLRRKPHSHSHD